MARPRERDSGSVNLKFSSDLVVEVGVGYCYLCRVRVVVISKYLPVS